MNQTLKTILTSALVAVLVVVGLRLVGNNQPGDLGATNGITRYPNSGLAAHYMKITTTPGTATAGTDGSFSVSGTALVSGAATFSSTVSATAATTTFTGANALWNSTSTGPVLRSTDGNCYRITLSGVGFFATSTAACL